ncbi:MULTISPECIES: TetR/AcrR family transcriptional regulator [Enterococcus]|uniref:TetR/AcrR family transcriptional regulator n=1 Tax=Enterococcus TaxID=1350 RepID=UPI00065E4217|nr:MULTISPECIES: TetR/AcrR family transcriptional regulator [Enterococcus]KAF1304968.1 TetR family transcriptional regulator [Enterococcus sp. JM9B]
MNGFEKRTEEKKQQVLHATFELMNSNTGIENVTVEEIVKQSGVSKATIFKYFGNKENLISEVFKDFLNRMGDTARQIMKENRPFEETIIAMSKNKIHFFEKVNKRFYIDLMDHVTQKKDDDLSTLMEEYSKESFTIMLDLFHRGRKEGKVALKYSDEFLLLYFEALVEGISNPRIYAKIMPYTQEWTEMILKGIAPDEG